MTNPAQELADLLGNWATWGDRDFSYEEEQKHRWQDRRYALDLLVQVDRAISMMAKAGLEVDFYRASYRAWYQATSDLLSGTDLDHKLQFEAAKEHRNLAEELIGSADFRLLKAFASHLASLNIALTVDQVELADLLENLSEAEKLVDSANLPIDEYRYIRALIDEARATAREVERFGTSTYRKFTAELGGELLRIVGQTENSTQRLRLLKVIGHLLNFGVSKFASKALETAGQESAQEAMQILTSGNGS